MVKKGTHAVANLRPDTDSCAAREIVSYDTDDPPAPKDGTCQIDETEH